MRLNRRALLPALLTLAACGDATRRSAAVVVDTLPGGIPRTMSSAPVEEGRWTLELARVIQPGEEAEGELMSPQSLAIADDGSVIVADSRPAVIKVYAPDGSYLRSFGREGAGPGEFRVAFIAVRGDTLVMQDPMNARATLFDWREGRLIRSVLTTCCYWSSIDVDGSGKAWLRQMAPLPDSSRTYGQAFVRLPLADAPSDTVFAYERAGSPRSPSWMLRMGGQVRMSMPVPMTPQAYFIIEPNGGLLTAWSGEYSIRVSRDGGDSVAVFGRQWTAIPLAAAERDRLYDAAVEGVARNNPQWDAVSVGASFERALIPGVRPAFEFIHADEAGRRWVRLSQPDTTRVAFDLFDAEGRWLDSLAVPQAQWTATPWAPSDFGAREIAIAAEGEDGRPLVRVFAIRRR